MPSQPYTWTHPDARLTQAERQQLAAGLEKTLGRGGLRGGVDADDDRDRRGR
jgi:hypothetical protein